MNPIGLCATDAKSLVAVIKAAQKAGIKRIVVTRKAFDYWWFFDRSADAPIIREYFRNPTHSDWVDDENKDEVWFNIWPAYMNPEGF